ncbi:MAG: hypothetical protein IKN63_03945 [Bacilli bacterium]|nr:hypothetical protein [Bacilli bacterium]
MEDKILKILKIKIDAINRNIDNLNYLNGELERNNADLEYIDEKIGLFKDNDILNFDNISKDEFDKILLMINTNVSDIFKDKTCNYDGIIYIIEGIRKSISLELTEDQNKAIMAFILGMKEKKVNLLETINSLSESKNRLPETDLTVLTNNLDLYNDIVSKFENKLYLTEIDEISDALSFASVSVEEKSDIFEYILKYNSKIYLNNKEEDLDKHIEENNSEENYEFNLPTFDKIDVDVPTDNKDEAKEEIEKENDLEDIKLNLDNLPEENKEEKVDNEFSNINATDDLPDLDNFTLNYDLPKFNDLPEFDVPAAESQEEKHELNTIELDDIIKKIDAKLKEMEENTNIPVESKEVEIKHDEEKIDEIEKPMEEVQSFEVPATETVEKSQNIEVEQPIQEPIAENMDTSVSKITINDLINKYTLPDLEITNFNLDDVDIMLNILSENNLLEEFKTNLNVLKLVINNSNSNNLKEVLQLVKENLIVKENELNDTYTIAIETMPIIFTNNDALNSFKENLKFFKEKDINIINIFDNYRELLIMNNEMLVDNYYKVMSYGLEINSDNVKYLLYNKNLLENLDYYIEAMGYEKGFLGKIDHFDGISYIKKNPYKLNSISRDTLLNLRYTTEKGGKIYSNKPGILSSEISNPKVDVIKLSDDYLNTYFNGKYTFINKNELKDIIGNIKNIDMTMDANINKLDASYKVDELKYNIDGVLISRIKAIRIYNLLKSKLSMKEALIVALTYNSVIKTTEYEKIVNIVENTLGGM